MRAADDSELRIFSACARRQAGSGIGALTRAGYSSYVRPCSNLPVLFFLTPPHCLKKNGTRDAAHLAWNDTRACFSSAHLPTSVPRNRPSFVTSTESRPRLRRLFAYAPASILPVYKSQFNSSRGYNGIFPCFLGGFLSRLISSIASAWISFFRVSRGWMTASTKPRSATT